ncbi:amidohydrolase family protein [Croceitalea rosinachiae]|uniref:Amidohydrolase family protein n=1 Tax=Croceitalea rosinachiae TaxID=3075596 RepID=A0ABU3ABQ4_9FLAO|nr:amidohydrolase family protein [Croceitalea sp. F388]MDT0607611.1 amidohydrolase family protein [Croceitalea sp. F388]
MKKCYMLALLAFLTLSRNSSQKIDGIDSEKKNPNNQTIKFIEGNWFNGKTFKKKTVWLKNSLISFEKEAEIDTVINLFGKYIIPPFAEAHNHNLESAYKLEERINSYLDNGVFYVKLLSSIKKRIAPLMYHYNKPDGLDVSMAHAPLTAKGGHPIALREKFFGYGRFKGLFNSVEEMEYHGYVIINTLEDLHIKWDSILSFSPDFIKTMLLHSEAYDKRKNDTAFFGRKGLDPKIFPEVVKKAHQSNLRVSVHANTAYDFHVAVNADVDEIAHLPEIHNGKPIAIEDALLAKKKGITVVTTISLVKKNKDKENYKDLVANVINNLKLLKKVGVKLAIGSDIYNDNSVDEFNFLHELQVFSNLELLKMWTENAVGTIFPNRKVGKLEDGYEGSFLVLDKNPLNDISNINKSIVLRVKEGCLLK